MQQRLRCVRLMSSRVLVAHVFFHMPPPPPFPAQRHKACLALELYADAIADLSAALELEPGYTAARLSRASVALRTGGCEAAVRDYDAVLAATPGQRDAAKRRPDAVACRDAIATADYYAERRQWDEAIASLEAATGPGRAEGSTALLMRRAPPLLV